MNLHSLLLVELKRRSECHRSDLLQGMSLFHTLQNLSPKCEQIRSSVTQDGCETTVQSSYKVITGENYDDWVKSFPKNVKVDQHLGRFFFSANVKVDPTPISLLRRKSRTPNFSQTAFNCSLRKTTTMREMKSSPVLCDLIYCPWVWKSQPTKCTILVSIRDW